MSSDKNALDILMENARNRISRKRPHSSFSCPAGCGARVTELDANVHLDRCLGGSSSNDVDVAVVARAERRDRADAGSSIDHLREGVGDERYVRPSSRSPAFKTPPVNAFSHMMERSVAVFSANKPGNNDGNIIRHRFHLHDAEGYVTWTPNNDGAEKNNDGPPNVTETGIDYIAEDGNATHEQIPPNDSTHSTPASSISIGEINWSAVITMKKVKCISSTVEDDTSNDDDGALELTMSSSLPSFAKGDETSRLVRKHSRLSVSSMNAPIRYFLFELRHYLSLAVCIHVHVNMLDDLKVSHLKSCLQKSIRRRAPLPAIRVAMELADRSWGDLIRRLPVIVLEDSTLHPNFGLLVWLMVAESKGYFPSMSLIKRVMQVVFELASWQDDPSGVAGIDKFDAPKLPTHLSLKTPTSKLFPRRHPSVDSCDVLIRSMLLRAQYGGMKCDVKMLHSYAVNWLKRFRTMVVPADALAVLASESSSRPIYWWDLPGILHVKAREKSAELVTSAIVCLGGLPKLNFADVCCAGIDFHCSAVVEHLLSRSEVFSSLCERLAPPKEEDPRAWMAGQLKSMIWNHSSGINHRRPLFETDKWNMDAPLLKAAWENVVRSSFDCYTKKFVMDRLA